MRSHNLELSLTIDHYDKDGKLKNSYTYPYADTSNNTINFTIRDNNGKVMCRKQYLSKSFVLNFLNLFSSAWIGTADNFTDVSGDPYLISSSYNMLNINAGSGQDSFGIWVGTSVISTSITDYLATGKVQHGSSSGQLMYGSTTIISPAAVAGAQRLVVRRDFTNNSSGSIVVRSTGIIAASENGTYNYLAMIDATDEADTSINVTIVPSQTFSVEYHFDIATSGDYVTNFLKVLQSCFGSSSINMQTSMYATAGSQSINYASFTHLRADAGAAIDVWGVVCGSSSTAKNMSTYVLGGQIQHGSGANQLMYGATQGTPIVVLPPYGEFSLI